MTGRFTADPVTRYGQSSQRAVTTFTLAINRGKDREGKDLGADYPNFVSFGKTAEFVERYCYKGMAITVEGHIRTRSYENRDGKKVYVTEIIADTLSPHWDNSKSREQIDAAKQDRKDAASVNAIIDGKADAYEDYDIPEGFSKLEDDIPF